MRLLGNRKRDVDKDKDGENEPKLEPVEGVLVHCSLIKNDYQHTSKVLFTFLSNKQFGQLINVSPHSLTMMKTVNTEFSSVEVWFTNQVSKALEIEDNVNLTHIIKMRSSIEPKYRNYVKGYGFVSFSRKFGIWKKISWCCNKNWNRCCKNCLKERVVQKTAKGTWDLIGNKIADKTKKMINKESRRNLHSTSKKTANNWWL